MNKLAIIPLLLLLASCSMGLSFDERYQRAYDDVVQEPTAENVESYMELSQQLADRDMRRASSEAEKATRESDKGFTEYFKKYGSEEFKKSNR
ncbi:hypothetical protein [Xenorhabdus sp. KJ12.1]|uniref:hypothetical protein n=1 Tax=Xenorhabdus sp. KJ12.1 TaxID=1851571 RepID=UPI000C0455C0|nr:hypothetical protein [Xenorhabdus sp. KJ12.1]PHM72308.1 ECA polysaccharide chain length modulation protein [Xenorhabdus sp. KJ12.1]